MVDGMEVLSYRLLPEDSKNAMSIVAAADYRVAFRPGQCPLSGQELRSAWEAFWSLERIPVVKKTKKSEQELDLRPFLYEGRAEEGDTLFLKLAAGSVTNIKPELVVQAFFRQQGWELSPELLLIERLELYADQGKDGVRSLISLEELGADIG